MPPKDTKDIGTSIATTKKAIEDIAFNEDFLSRARRLKEEMHKFYTDIGKEETPKVDGEGRKIVRKRPDGMDYIIEAYMRKCLDKHFPGWSWEAAAPLQFLAAEWVVAQGHLVIIDEHLVAFGVIPPVRRFYGVDSVRIQYRKEGAHAPENIIDVGDNCKQANSAALKYAINRLCNIGDDVYGKRIEEEGAGKIEDVIMNTKDEDLQQKMFFEYLASKGIKTYGTVFKLLGISSFEEITDWQKAYKTIEESY